MSKSIKATWLGDGDPQSQIIFMGDLRFIKGEAVTVPADHEFAERIAGNPVFSVDNDKREPVDVSQPSDEELTERGEEGTEKAALKAQLKARGVVVKGNPSEDTLRTKLADVSKDETSLSFVPGANSL